MDEIPHDQEIIHIPHGLNDAQLVIQPLPEAPVVIRIALLKALQAQLI